MMRSIQSRRSPRRRHILSRCIVAACATLLSSPVVSFAQDADADARERANRAMQRRLEIQQAQIQRAQQQVIIQGNNRIVVQGGVVIAPAGRVAANADGTDDAKTTGVFVRDSAVAGEKLALAERMERLKEWDTSAEVYQEVLDQYSDRVLPIHNDAQGRPDRFGSVTSVVQDRIAAWPEEGRTVYLSRYELPARRMFESSSLSNRADLMKVVNRYFITSAGRDAALILIESYFDHAEFIAAAMLCDRLLEKHPQLDGREPILLTRSALSWHLAGEDARGKQRADRLKSSFADTTDSIGGKPQNLSGIVASALAAPRQLTPQQSGNSWRLPFGSNDHTAIVNEQVDTSAPRIWAKLQSIPFRSPARAQAVIPDQLDASLMMRRQRDMGASTGMLPSVDGSQLFFQDNASVYAYDLDRGEPMMGWLATYPAGGKFTVNAAAMPRGVQMTTTLTDRFVLAILGQFDNTNMGGVDVQTPVVCLDRTTGRLNWSASLQQVKTDDDALRNARPCGSVIVAGDAVYVVARSRNAGAFEDSYLCCFSLEDGTLRWSRHLASGNSTRNFNDYNLPVQSSGDSHLAYADGSVFVSTDMGGVACVNAADGSLTWLSVYPRPLASNPQAQWAAINAGTIPKVKPAFTGNPVIVRDGKVISLPGDSEQLLIHDAVTGELLGSVALGSIFLSQAPSSAEIDARPAEKYNVLVGTVNDTIVVAGARSLAILDLNKIVGARSFQDVQIRYREFCKSGLDDDTIRGRPFITSNSIYVPTAWKLFRMNVDTSLALEMYPAGQDTWEGRPDEHPGNAVFSGDSLLIAGPTELNIYADLSLLRKRMEVAVAADAKSINPRLRYADALFNAGQTDESIKWIDSSIKQLTTNGLVSPGPDRDRVFDMLSGMFQRLSEQEQTDATLKVLLDRIAQTADTPTQQISLQLSRAYLGKRTSDFATAINAYQTLLDDGTISVMRVRSGAELITIRDYATAAIAEVIESAGRDVYGSVETRAQAALASAQISADPSTLYAVMEAFPNSTAGQQAATLAIQSTLSGKSVPRDLLRRIGSRVTEAPQKAQLIESLLRSDLAAGNVDSALGRARSLAQLEPNRALSSLPTLDSKAIDASSAADLVATLQQLSFAEQDQHLPDLKVPDKEPIFDTQHPIDSKGVRHILIPSNPRGDRLVAIGQDDRSVRLYQPGAAAPVQTIAINDVPDHAQTIWRGDMLVVTSPKRVAMLDTKAGSVTWTFDPQSLKPAGSQQQSASMSMSIDAEGLLETLVEPATTPAPRQVDAAVQQRIQVANRINRQRIIRQMNDGEQQGVWEADDPTQQARETISYTRSVSDYIVLATSRGRVISLDAKTGEVRWQANFSDRPPSMVGVYDDLIAIGGNNESSSSLVVYRAKDGVQVISQNYNGPLQRRLNTLAVSREGYLAAVHNDFIDVFDLATGNEAPIATFDGQGQLLFQTTRVQEFVQFCGDKLLVLIGSAGQQQQVRMFDTLTLAPTIVTDPKTMQAVDRQFTPSFTGGTKPGDPSARMYVHKDRLLLRAGRDFTVYNVLASDRYPWARMADRAAKDTMSSQSPVFVRGGVFIAKWPAEKVSQNIDSCGIEYYKRESLADSREAGTVLDEFNLKRPGAKVMDRIQVVNGGFYTVWSDAVLSFTPIRSAN